MSIEFKNGSYIKNIDSDDAVNPSDLGDMVLPNSEEVEAKAKEIQDKWESKMKEQGLTIGNKNDAYKFYRTNLAMIQEDVYDLLTFTWTN